MKKYLLATVLFFANQLAFSQTNSNIDTSKKATIEIHLTNSLKKPLTKEEVIISSDNNKLNYKLITDAKGNASVTVKTGYTYTVKLKTIDDTTTYGTIEIPAITSKQAYSSPFVLDMVYEPAKDYTFHNLEFDIAKATIKSSSFKELDLVAEYLTRKSDVSIEITGHTDNAGDDNSNKVLSKQRADAVKKYLAKKGIVESRVQTIGLGATQPIADNSTIEGRQKNRRTEIKFLEK